MRILYFDTQRYPEAEADLRRAIRLLEDAGYYPESLAGEDGVRDVGVFVGAWIAERAAALYERACTARYSTIRSFTFSSP